MAYMMVINTEGKYCQTRARNGGIGGCNSSCKQ